MSLEQESRGTRFAGIELALAIVFASRKSYFVPESRTTACSVAGYQVGAKWESGRPAGFIGSVMVSRLRLHHVGDCQNCLQTDEAKECGFPTCPILTLLEWRRRRQGASFRSMRRETSMFSHRGYGGAAATWRARDAGNIDRLHRGGARPLPITWDTTEMHCHNLILSRSQVRNPCSNLACARFLLFSWPIRPRGASVAEGRRAGEILKNREITTGLLHRGLDAGRCGSQDGRAKRDYRSGPPGGCSSRFD